MVEAEEKLFSFLVNIAGNVDGYWWQLPADARSSFPTLLTLLGVPHHNPILVKAGLLSENHRGGWSVKRKNLDSFIRKCGEAGVLLESCRAKRDNANRQYLFVGKKGSYVTSIAKQLAKGSTVAPPDLTSIKCYQKCFRELLLPDVYPSSQIHGTLSVNTKTSASANLPTVVTPTEGQTEDRDQKCVKPESKRPTMISPCGQSNMGVHDETIGESHIAHNIPNSHQVFQKSYVERLRKDAEDAKKLKKYISKKIHTSTVRSRILLGKIVAACPTVAYDTFHKIYVSSVAHFLLSAGIDVPFDNLVASCPSSSTISSSVDWAAAGTVNLLSHVLKESSDPRIYLGCDKGGNHLVTYMYFFNQLTEKTEAVMIGADESLDSTKGVSKALDFALDRINIDKSKRLVVHGQMTDSGGGGTLESLEGALRNHGLCSQSEYFVGNCSLHNYSNAFAYPFKKCFGEGGVDVINPIQAAHSCWDLQEQFDPKLWKMFWEASVNDLRDISDEERQALHGAKRIPAAVLTRWKYVAQACMHVVDHWKAWEQITSYIINMYNADSKVGKIASGLYSQLKNPFNRVYLEFISIFSRNVHLPFMEQAERKDPMAGEAGFGAKEVLAHYFSYLQTSVKLHEAFKNPDSPEYATFRDLQKTMENEDIETSSGVCLKFFNLHEIKAHKMFSRWFTSNLILFAVFSSSRVSQVVANLLLDLETPNDPTTSLNFSGDLECNQFTLSVFSNWLVEATRPHIAQIRCDLGGFINKHKDALTVIAEGHNMWDAESDLGNNANLLINFRTVFKKCYQSFPSQNQRVEAGVKKSNDISFTGRASKKNSAYAIASNFSLGNQALSTNEQTVTRTKFIETWHQIQNQLDMIDSLQLQDGDLEQTTARFVANSEDLQEHRRQEQMAMFNENKNETKAPNKRQLRTEFTHTPLAKGEVMWKDLRKASHLNDLFNELVHRLPEQQAELEELFKKGKWNDMRKVLIKNEGKSKSFKPRCPDPDQQMFHPAE